MRLLLAPDNTHPIQTEEFIGDGIPKYAILSHTWGTEEVSLQEFSSPSASTGSKSGLDKIRTTSSKAKERDGLEYTWVDTCCIDKTSSAELTEAINSMYAWYAGAEVCYAYLSDLDPGADLETALPQCKWFTRGWTLQELVAPRHVIFFDRDWNEIGNKNELSNLLYCITNIPVELLQSTTRLEHYSVARRMSWAARRKTTRIEDLAYCLLGIFEVNLALIYGEGKRAFKRLQEAIVLSAADRSVFMWTENRGNAPTQLLVPIFAEEPCQFADCGNIISSFDDTVYANLTINPRGVQVFAAMASDPDQEDDAYRCIFDTHCTDNGVAVGIAVRRISGGRYARYKPRLRVTFPERRLWRTNRPIDDFEERKPPEYVTLATRISENLPFPGTNTVLGNRQCAFRVNWLTPGLSLVNFRPMPRSHWDYHHEVWFSCTTVSNGWCAFFARGFIALPDDSYVPVHLLVSCHYWPLGLPNLFIASLHDMDTATLAILEAQLDSIEYESARHAQRLLFMAFGRNLLLDPDGKVMTGKVLIIPRHMQDEMQYMRLPLINYIEVGVKVEINAEVKSEFRPDLCSSPMWRLDISCRVIREGPES
ncbi:vegetative incompatibility protein HET-E-1 [Rhypophila sp. PSN 637]